MLTRINRFYRVKQTVETNGNVPWPKPEFEHTNFFGNPNYGGQKELVPGPVGFLVIRAVLRTMVHVTRVTI